MKVVQKFRKARPVAAAFGIVALVGVIPANAADVVTEQPPAPPAAAVSLPPLNTWSGPYAGVTLGYGFAGHTDAPGNHIGTDGFNGSGFAGYNWQSNSFVYGVEGDLGYSGIHGSNAGTSTHEGFNGSLRARVGVAPSQNILLYGTAGGAADRLKVEDAAGSDSNAMLGWTAGAGIDAKITGNIFARAEYRYTDYGHKTFDTGSGPQSVGDTDNNIMLGVGFKF